MLDGFPLLVGLEVPVIFWEHLRQSGQGKRGSDKGPAGDIGSKINLDKEHSDRTESFFLYKDPYLDKCFYSQHPSTLMLEFLSDLWNFMRIRKKFWLAPIIIVLLLFGILIVLAEGTAVAPFVYTLF